ncbi:MAG: DUF979 domain-containing protein [Lachnospiraceae bacterium]
MSFFTSVDVTIGEKLLEVIYIVFGLIAFNAGVKNALDKENPSRFGTAMFWCLLGVVLAFGRWLPAIFSGVLVVLMTLPAILRKVKIGRINAPDAEYTARLSDKIGMKIFVPALSIGIVAIIFSIFLKDVLGSQASMIGVGVGVIISIVVLMLYSSDNKPAVFLKDSERQLSMVGPLCMLPQLLASLGAIFTAAGVGEIIAGVVGKIIPQGNVNVGIIVFAIGMVLFTIIMGNAFAAIMVMTVGIGAPFVLAYGANPVVIGMLALTCGYCGTLCTPMAANFNIVPVAMLDMKDRFGVIKNQVVLALIILVFQIGYMILFK